MRRQSESESEDSPTLPAAAINRLRRKRFEAACLATGASPASAPHSQLSSPSTGHSPGSEGGSGSGGGGGSSSSGGGGGAGGFSPLHSKAPGLGQAAQRAAPLSPSVSVLIPNRLRCGSLGASDRSPSTGSTGSRRSHAGSQGGAELAGDLLSAGALPLAGAEGSRGGAPSPTTTAAPAPSQHPPRLRSPPSLTTVVHADPFLDRSAISPLPTALSPGRVASPPHLPRRWQPAAGAAAPLTATSPTSSLALAAHGSMAAPSPTLAGGGFAVPRALAAPQPHQGHMPHAAPSPCSPEALGPGGGGGAGMEGAPPLPEAPLSFSQSSATLRTVASEEGEEGEEEEEKEEEGEGATKEEQRSTQGGGAGSSSSGSSGGAGLLLPLDSAPRPSLSVALGVGSSSGSSGSSGRGRAVPGAGLLAALPSLLASQGLAVDAAVLQRLPAPSAAAPTYTCEQFLVLLQSL